MENPEAELWDRAARGDAMGEMMHAYYRREPAFGVMERDDGLVQPHDPRLYLSPPHEWGRLEHAACDRVMGRVLDIGCAAGRHAIYLQAKGYEVTGIDPSPGMCETARSRGLRDVHELCVEEVGKLDGSFDTVLMLGSNLGLLGSPRKAVDVLEAIAASAAPAARILGNGIDPYVTDDPVHLEYHARNRARGRMPGQVRIRPRFRRLVGDWVDLLWCSTEELRTLVASTPWRLSTVDTEENGSYLAELSLR